MIQKIKLYGISMGAAAVILLSGAWKNLPEKEPEATEAIVLQDEVTQENQSAVKETQAREEAVKWLVRYTGTPVFGTGSFVCCGRKAV